METKRLRSVFIAGIMVMMGVSALGQKMIENTFYGKPGMNKAIQVQNPLLDMSKYDVIKSNNRTVYRQKVAQTENDETVTLTLQLVYDENKYMCDQAIIYTQEDDTYFLDIAGDKLQQGDIPKGEYDLFCEFRTISPVNPSIYIIKEKVCIQDDITITIDSSEATNYISFENLRPDGSSFNLDLGYIDNEKGFVITEKGDIDIEYIYTIDKNIIASSRSLNIAYLEGLNRDWSNFGIKINDCSDRYAITRTYIFKKDNTFWISNYEIDDLSSNTYKNNIDDYCYVEEHYKPSMYGSKSSTCGYGISMLNHCGINTPDVYLGNFSDNDYYVKLFINSQEEYTTLPNKRFLYSSMFFDYAKEVIMPWGAVWNEVQVCFGPCFCIRDGKPFYMNVGQLFTINDYYFTDDYQLSGYPHPQFSYEASKRPAVFGTTVPILSLANQTFENPYSDQNMFDLRFNYIGRLGEQRQNDFDALTFDLKYNGETVCNDYNMLQSLSEQWAGESKEAGVIDLTVVNDNVEVDGFIGKNTAHVYFDQTKEDGIAPTLQMLQFRDPEGMITDRFNTAADGIMEFAGGDFDYHFNPLYRVGYFDCAEQTVEVAYSPYGKDSWSELAVEEIPENYFMPGFGYFYRGSLKDVTGQAEKGWFDLKIRLEDEAGNWQEQVISPAFRIDDLVDTGISHLRIDNGQLTIPCNETVYDVMGRRVADKSSKAMKGIQIVRRQNGNVRKVVVR